ncbi:MAG: ATP-binding protein [Candidatus Omnitrophota bacterium]|nr:ATP-binding protein [Candidatus Omnitrophota bacterium]
MIWKTPNLLVSDLWQWAYYEWNPYAFAFLIASVLMLLLGAYIAVHGGKTSQKWTFLGICGTFFIWLWGTFLVYSVRRADLALFYIYIAYAGGSFISVSLYAYAAVWLGRVREHRPWIIAGYLGGAVLLALIVSTDWIVYRVEPFFWGYHSQMTPLGGGIFLSFFFTYLVLFFITLYQGWRSEANPVAKRQVRLVGVAFLIATVGSSDLLPCYGVEVFPLGGLTMFIAVFALGYTIIRYKLLDIETVIHKTLMWLGSTVFALIPFAALIYATRTWSESLSAAAATSYYLVLSIAFYFYFQALQPYLNHVFRRRHANLQAAVNEFSSELVHLKDLSHLLRRFVRMLRRTVYTQQTAVYLKDENSGDFVPTIAKGLRHPQTLSGDHPLVAWMEERNEVLVTALVQDDPAARDFKVEMVKCFNDLQAMVVVPFALGGKLVGFVCLGKRENLRKYGASEVFFLSQIKSPVTIALSNSMQFDHVSKLYKQVQAQNDRLKELDRLKSEFLANTSHELRTPLHGILGLVEALLDGADGDINDRQSRHLKMIVQSGSNLKELINNLLELSRLESGQAKLEVKPFNVLNVVDAAIALMEGLALKKNIRLGYSHEGSLPDVYGDPEKIQRVLINLLGNALKFTEAGEVTVCVSDEEDRLRISVQDTGVGIAPEDQRIIFDRFRQADGSSTRAYEGTGLGLSITREIVKLHGSDVGLRSEVGQGSEFFFYLPKSTFNVAEVHKMQLEQPTASAARDGTPKTTFEGSSDRVYTLEKDKEFQEAIRGDGERILIIDDNAVNREVAKTRLEINNYRVIEAADGVEGLHTVENEKPDLIVLDLMMPRMSGYEFCKKLRERYTADELPVIMLTAKTEMGDKVYGLQIGANDYVSKPFNKEELLARVGVLLKIRAMNRELRKWNTELEERVEERTDELIKTQGQLIQAEKLATIGILAGGVAHEINNPLTAVLTNAQILKMTANSEDQESLDLIEQGAKRCQTIIKKLMKYARKSPQEPAMERVDINRVAESTRDMLSYQFKQDNVDISLHLESVPMIQGNANELEQVLTNLLVNSRDAIREAGRAGEIHIYSTAGNGRVEVRVSDNGTGIKEEYQKKIFDPFYTGKDVGAGTGLGLAVSQSIVQRHQGEISVQSDEGKGTTFTIWFPTEEPHLAIA